MPLGRFEAVFIDFYGTIASGDRQAVLSTCIEIVSCCSLPVTPHDFAIQWGERFFKVIEQSNHEKFQTLHVCEMVSLSETLACYDCDQPVEPLVAPLERYWENPTIYPDALVCLQSLQVPVCCVSNADHRPLIQAIERNDLKFDAVISSEAARCYKPDPGIFKRALDALGVDPDQCLHIGDSLHSDVGGARRAGIKSAWICRSSRIHDVGTEHPEFTIATLTDLKRLRTY